MALFVRNKSPLKFKMRHCSQRKQVKELILGGGGVFLENDADGDGDVIDVVPSGGGVMHEKSVAAQFVFSSAVKNCQLKLEMFLLDGRLKFLA